MPPSQKFGVSPEDLPHMDLMSNTLRKHIIEGRDINLATLLITYYDINNKDKDKEDVRLKRPLSITEFITAFGRYKRVMCQAYPDRREELDKYEAIIVGIYNVYGDKFYEYHKLFSLKSANALMLHKLKVDWSIRDRDLLQLVSAGARSKSCNICGEVTHEGKFCPLSDRQTNYHTSIRQFNNDNALDKHGRKRVMHNGLELCNNFNSKTGCIRVQCPYSHLCARCKAKEHGMATCQVNAKAGNLPSISTTQTKKTDK